MRKGWLAPSSGLGPDRRRRSSPSAISTARKCAPRVALRHLENVAAQRSCIAAGVLGEAGLGLAEAGVQAHLVPSVVVYCGTSLDAIEQKAGLRRDAARGLVARESGQVSQGRNEAWRATTFGGGSRRSVDATGWLERAHRSGERSGPEGQRNVQRGARARQRPGSRSGRPPSRTRSRVGARVQFSAERVSRRRYRSLPTRAFSCVQATCYQARYALRSFYMT